MFKRVSLCLFLFVFFTSVFAQNSAQPNAEIVIMMDTSGMILPYYEDINNRVLAEINNKFIRKGDTVHIISFNADARYEMSQKINSEKDMSRIVSRFLLLYQLGKNSDFLTGLHYARQYTSNLSAKKDKILIIISDGIFNPPSFSPYKNYSDEQIKNEIGLLAGSIRKKGWEVYYVKLPYPADAIIRNLDGEEFYNSGKEAPVGRGTEDKQGNADKSGGEASSNSAEESQGGTAQGGSTNAQGSSDSGVGQGSSSGDSLKDVSKTFKEASGASSSELSKDKKFTINDNAENLPLIYFPDNGLEARGNKLDFSFDVKNTSEENIELHLTHIVIDNGININKIEVNSQSTKIKPNEKTLIRASAVLPAEYTEGNYNIIMRLEFADGKRVLPQVTETSLAVFPSSFRLLGDSNSLWFILLAILLLILAIIFIVFVVRKKDANTSFIKENEPVSYKINYTEEDKRQPVKISEDENANRLNAFNNASNSTASTENKKFAGTGSSMYSPNNLERIANQRQDDEALRKRVLAASFAVKEPRGTYMKPANFFEKVEIRQNKSGMTEIYVLNQNRNIGMRNIHVMKPGTSLTLGGGKKDNFFIFLVPFPSHLAQLRYDGKDYHLAILKPKYFPYEKSNVINNCIGKTITLVSDRGYHVYFTFREYENATEKLNNILTSISVKSDD